jgi:deoxyribodipyrimidine photo-lyase
VRFLAVDGNGLLPMREPGQAFPTAIAFRRHLHRHLAPHLGQLPAARPLGGKKLPAAEIPGAILRRWPAGIPDDLAGLPIDHAVAPSPIAGGSRAARKHLKDFLARVDRYGEERNDPDQDAGSGFSPYLHHGQIATAEIFAALAEQEGWNPGKLGGGTIGHKAGYWGMSPSAESFLDELVTWRELGYGFAAHRADHAEWSSLPEWAQKDLLAHAGDPREHVYGLEDFASASTHDELWNAAQRQLRQEGRIHNYLRMLWGKKILEWTRHPKDALQVLIELNNRYAIDGRDPNSYTGIFWVLGRHDRPWAPRRPIFGVIRYMSSDATRRKLEVKQYLRRWSGQT